MPSDDDELGKSEVPQKVVPFWSWPWSSYGRWQIAWIALRHVVVKPVLAVTALIAAFLLIAQVAPDVWHKIAWRQTQYALLADIHAGYNLQYISEKLGEPAAVSVVVDSPRLVQHIYVGRDYFVGVVTNSTDQAVLVSFVSCDQNFAPSFIGPLGSTVRLQSVPIAEAEVLSSIKNMPRSVQLAENMQANDRSLTYVPGSTGGSLDQLIETGIASGSNATRNRNYYIGVNGACGETLQHGVKYSEVLYSGSLATANPDVIRTRQETAANFYTETYDISVSLGSDGALSLIDEKGKVQDGTRFFATPWFFDLPPQITKFAGTRHFAN